MSRMTPVEMFNELVKLGYVTAATFDPSRLMVPTAYVSVPTAMAFYTPPTHTAEKDSVGAKLDARPKRNPKRKRHAGRRVRRRQS